MIVEKSEFIYILNDYHGTVKNFPFYFKEAFYRLQKERAITISAYTILKQYTGVSIPKLERFLKIDQVEEEEKTVEQIKDEFVASGGYIIKKGE